MNINAAVQLSSRGSLSIRALKLAEPRINEVMVKMVACGVCHTDIVLQKYSVYYPIVLGHEGSGIIEGVGRNVKHLKPGDHVVLSYTYCGKCNACKVGKTYACKKIDGYFDGLRPDGTSPLSLNGQPVAALISQGGFSTYVVCHQNAVTKVSNRFDLRYLGPLGCGIMTGAGSVFNYLKPQKGKSIVIFGTGCVGLSAIMAAKVSGCHPIISVDKVSVRLKMAKQFGSDYCINSEKTKNIETAIGKICNGIDYAFDTSGNDYLLSVLRSLLKPGASACGVGIGGSIELTQEELDEGKSWETTNDGFSIPQQMIPKLLSLYKSGKFPFDKMIRFFELGQINDAFKASHDATVIKPVLLMN